MAVFGLSLSFASSFVGSGGGVESSHDFDSDLFVSQILPCFFLLLDSGWDGIFCLLVCFTYYLSLVCLRHLSTYCYSVSLLRMTMMCVSMLVHSVWGLLWCNIVYIHMLQIYRSTQPQHFEIRSTTVEGKGVKPS